jgi:hypothetical protein
MVPLQIVGHAEHPPEMDIRRNPPPAGRSSPLRPAGGVPQFVGDDT